MQNAIVQLLDTVASLLGPLSPFTKAVVPAALAVAVAIIHGLFAGSIDPVSITIAATGLIAALLVYLLPNKAAQAGK